MTAAIVLSLTEAQALNALGTFLMGLCASSDPTQPFQVVRAEGNLVAEPACPDFCVMTPLRQERLSTNETSYFDNVLTGSIAGTVLSVANLAQQESPLSSGMLLIDAGWPTMNVAANTVLGPQLSGTPGGVGTYTVSPSQTLASETLYAGQRADLVPTRWVVQLDVHGPASGNNARIIELLFRSEYAVDAFEAQLVAEGAPSFSVVPLYCGEPRQTPFINGEQQYEYRWTIDAEIQISPIVSTPQQFADQVVIKTIEAAPNYSG